MHSSQRTSSNKLSPGSNLLYRKWRKKSPTHLGIKCSDFQISGVSKGISSQKQLRRRAEKSTTKATANTHAGGGTLSLLLRFLWLLPQTHGGRLRGSGEYLRVAVVGLVGVRLEEVAVSAAVGVLVVVAHAGGVVGRVDENLRNFRTFVKTKHLRYGE